MGVIPDKLIMLDKRDGEIIEYLQSKIRDAGPCKQSLKAGNKQA